MSQGHFDEPVQGLLLPELADREVGRDIRSDLAERCQASDSYCPGAHDREALALHAAGPVAIRLGLKNVAGHRSTSLTSRMLRGQAQGFELSDLARWDVEAQEEERRNGATRKRELIAAILGGLLPGWSISYEGQAKRPLEESMAAAAQGTVKAQADLMLGKKDAELLDTLMEAAQAMQQAVLVLRGRQSVVKVFPREVS